MYPSVMLDSLNRMKRRLKKIVFQTNTQKGIIFAFIDAQNIAKSIKNAGWNINWSTFRQWLAENYNVSEAYMYIGYMEKNQDLYLQLNNNGFNIVFKQMIKSGQEAKANSDEVKGNVDVDLTVGVWEKADKYDQAVIITGDGDFVSLLQHLLNRKKLKNIIVPEFYSTLFAPFDKYIVKINDYRDELVYIKKVKQPAHKTPSQKDAIKSPPPGSRRRQIKKGLKKSVSFLNKTRD